MHVLLITPWYKPQVGGVVNSVVTLAEHLLREGHDCTVLMHTDSDAIKYLGRDGHLPVFGMHLRSFFDPHHPLRAALAWVVYLLPSLLRLHRFIRTHAIDLVEIHFPNAWSFYFPILRKVFRIPYLVRVHGSDVHVLMHEHWAVARAVRTTVARASALVACSRRLLSDTRHIVRTLPGRAEAIYVGVLPEWAHLRREQSITLHERPYIISNGFPVNIKESDILVRAFAQIADRYPDVDLVLIGSRPDECILVDLINELRLQNRVKLLGAVPHNELPAIFENALFGVVPSRREAFGQVALELQLLKEAVIVSRVGGLPESISDGYTGFLVPPEDVDALAQQMAFCLDNPQLCNEIGKNGHDRVLREFTVENTGRQSIQLYRWICSR